MIDKTEVEQFNSLLDAYESSYRIYCAASGELKKFKSIGYKHGHKERMRDYKLYANCMKEKVKDRYPQFRSVRNYGYELVFGLTLEFASISDLPLEMVVSPVNIFVMSKPERHAKGRKCTLTEVELECEYNTWLHENPDHEEWFSNELEDCMVEDKKCNRTNKFKQLDSLFDIDENSAILLNDVCRKSGYTLNTITDWAKSLCLPAVKHEKITIGKKGDVELITGIKFREGIDYKLYDFSLSRPEKLLSDYMD